MVVHREWEHGGLFESWKEQKNQRKIASAKDRSKYKKTDLDSQKKRKIIPSQDNLKKSNLKRGRVIAIGSEGIFIDLENKLYICSLRGILKKEKTLLKNLVIVGDFVWFKPYEKTSKHLEGIIEHVEPRKSTLSRADNLSRRKEHLIAANIDQVIITTSVVNPTLKPTLLDRYIIACYKGFMAPVIVINKIDLLHSDDPLVKIEKELYEKVVIAYSLAGVPVISVSIKTGEGIENLRNMMKNKASVFAGQSGVGKSSLINAIAHLNLPVGETVAKTKKGSHTTSQAQLIHLDFEGWCIDTPGIKSFGLWNLTKDEVLSYYPEFNSLSQYCKYPNCTHRHEPECAVLKAIKEGSLPSLRYESYLQLTESIEKEHLRR